MFILRFRSVANNNNNNNNNNKHGFVNKLLFEDINVIDHIPAPMNIMLGSGKMLIDSFDSFLIKKIEILSKPAVVANKALEDAENTYKTAKSSNGNPKDKKPGKLRTEVTKAKEILAKAIKEMQKLMTDGFNDIIHGHRISREAYHGGTLIGEHVRQLLQNGDDIMDKLKLLVLDDSENHKPYAESEKEYIITFIDNMMVAMKILNVIFHTMNDAYTIHTDLQCRQFETLCTFIGRFWREALEISVPPKIHLLESHVATLMWRIRCIGCFSEQPIER
jgi:hypothetical protein